MKKIKKYFFAGMFFTFLLSNTFAQTVSTSSTNSVAEKQAISVIDEISKEVTLTTDQIQKITPFVTQFYEQKDIDQAQYKENRDLLTKAAKARKETLMTNLKTVLSEDQIAKIKEYLQKQNTKEKMDTDKIIEK